MHSRLRAISLHTLLATLLLLPGLAAAAQTSPYLQHLLRLHLAAQKSLGDFYMYNSMEGDQRYARMIDESRREASEQLSTLAGIPDVGAARLHAQLQQQWQAYDRDLSELMAALAKQGYTDLQPVADMAARNRQVLATSQALYEALQRTDPGAISEQTASTRELSLLMQGIAVSYAARSASVGASFSGDSSERPIEDQVTDFSSRLTALRNRPDNDARIDTALDAVTTKWRYIEKSLRNYNEKSVPFLVNKYSDSIIRGLMEVTELYARQDQVSEPS
ncbi:hypothetical protein M2262_001875 [Pseudomonas sp. BIGb0408]|uniref:Type IV pili methyl-accepting chemotaxis transducer N-term n=1 Tax=Phytopseudomonas flavescens TaxID=29435 RepID=A0A7Y9XNZ1_9GAMM|nr:MULTISPECIES: hypothetical protein [Pseudomonas]MCW2291825.1 hypothetical protein [Pseudomonas sp. BIGb0408]NYH73604.1 hypothetical protein [Pseudomonas flavescens]